MTGLNELLADCKTHGILLLPAGDSGLTIDAPQDALSPEMIERLKAHKTELRAILRAGGDTHTPAPDPSIDVRTVEQSLADEDDWINEAPAPLLSLQSERQLDWSAELKRLIQWYEDSRERGTLPTPPFQLRSGVRVFGSKFYTALDNDIVVGPNGPRAWAGLPASLEDPQKLSKE